MRGTRWRFIRHRSRFLVASAAVQTSVGLDVVDARLPDEQAGRGDGA
jgi:hypothetical protein